MKLDFNYIERLISFSEGAVKNDIETDFQLTILFDNAFQYLARGHGEYRLFGELAAVFWEVFVFLRFESRQEHTSGCFKCALS